MRVLDIQAQCNDHAVWVYTYCEEYWQIWLINERWVWSEQLTTSKNQTKINPKQQAGEMSIL